MLKIFLYVLPIVLSVYCLVQAITSRDEDIRHLPKIGWMLLILFFPLVGSAAWLIAGQPRAVRPQAGPATAFPEYDRPGRAAATSPDADDEFLRKVKERAEEQRRAYQAKKRAEAAERARLEAERQQREQGESPDA